MNHSYDISYFDTLRGGSGQTRVLVADLHTWLTDHPGYLIRALQPSWLI